MVESAVFAVMERNRQAKLNEGATGHFAVARALVLPPRQASREADAAMTIDPRRLLMDMFEAAVGAALPEQCLPPHLPPRPPGRTIVVGAGKASGAMAKAVEDHWHGPLEGLVVTRYGHGAHCQRIEVAEASHPVPDAAGEAAAKRILAMVKGLSPEDLVLCLISGGGSALLALPAEGVSLADKQGISKALLKSGATISEMNCVRRHLSAIKGGRLAAAAAPARMVTLMISDVPGDDPCVIASGPTVADPTTSAEALAILQKYAIAIPANIRAHLRVARRRNLEAGRPEAGRGDEHHDRDAANVACGRGRRGAQGGHRAPHSRQCHRRRGARRRLGPCGDRKASSRICTASGPALRSDFRRRNNGDPARVRAVAAATPNFCSRFASPWMAIQAFTRLPQIPTESTAQKIMLARCFCPIAFRARRIRAYQRKLCSPTTTPIVFSPRSEISW